MEIADVILLVVDTQEGLLPLDSEVAKRLRYVEAPILLVANKTDHREMDSQADEFYKLGRGKLIRTSTTQNRGRAMLMKMILDRLPAEIDRIDAPEEPVMKAAIVGRRNTGKSTFVNTLARAERMIVSEIAGTTRDAVDVRFELDGKSFIAIDTPGLKREKSVKTDMDFYSTHRAKRSIRRADVVLLFIDASERISKLDKQLCGYISENYKPCIFVVNKWDLYADAMPTSKWVTYLRENFPSMWHAPIAFITGQTGKNVKALINHGQMLFAQSRERISTSKLNQWIRAALDHHPPPIRHRRRPKIYYGTQVGTQPPTIVMFCNDPKAFDDNYRRYLYGVLRDKLSFGEVPIKIYLRKRASSDKRDDVEAKIRPVAPPADSDADSPSPPPAQPHQPEA